MPIPTLSHFEPAGGSVERFVEAQDSDGEQTDSRGGHREHLGPENLHARTFQIGAAEHHQKMN